jgi:glycine cleavage system transcriptional repressor
MAKELVLTLTGHDKIGLVEHVTDLVLKCKSNIGASRMAHLGGEFAMMMHLKAPDDQYDCLKKEFNVLKEEGFTINMVETNRVDTAKFAGWIPYQIKMTGADHEGVVHVITHHFTKNNINIENMETSVVSAPMSGIPLFSISAVIVVPPDITFQQLEAGLEKVGDELNMDADVSRYTG